MTSRQTPDPRSQDPSGKKKTPPPQKRGCAGCLVKLFILLLLVGAVALAGASVWGALYVQKLSATLPSTDEILQRKPNLATHVFDRHGKLLARLFQEDRVWVPFEKISPWMVKAILAAEDSSFYEHGGVRPFAILRSILTGDRGHGASTITQQLARNLFLSRETTMERKAKEALLSFRIEKIFTKDQILEMYLNTIYFGHGAWGIGAAARTYYDKSAEQLNLGESSMLAGIVAAPEKYSPRRSPELAASRQNYVLRRMVDVGFISPSEATEVKETPLKLTKLSKSGLESSSAPYFVSQVLFKHLLPKYGTDQVYQQGLTVHTTLDLELQRAAEEAIQGLKTEGAIVALDPKTGEVLAMVGGKNFNVSKFNRATQAFRQPGSAFKPFVYTAATEQGIRPVDRILDAPLSYGNGWSPQNFDGQFHGEMTLLNAIINSYNTAAVRLAELVGPDKILDVVRRMGLTTPHITGDLSLALGSASVTPLDLVTAYAPFANGGFRVSPFLVREIRSNTGEVLEQNGASLVPALAPEVAATVRSMLQDAVLAGTGSRARVKGWETFGKTGTANDFRDAWFVGGVPNLVVVVYAGNDDHSPIGKGKTNTGGVIAAPVWNAFVTKAAALLGLPPTFSDKESAQVQEVRVCKLTGYLASKGCSSLPVLLPYDLVPTAVCPQHGGDPFEAENDLQAPRLYLAGADEPLLAQYAFGGISGTAAATAALPRASEVRPLDPIFVPLPTAQSAYEKDPSPANQIEERYQDLLKQYGLSN